MAHIGTVLEVVGYPLWGSYRHGVGDGGLTTVGLIKARCWRWQAIHCVAHIGTVLEVVGYPLWGSYRHGVGDGGLSTVELI